VTDESFCSVARSFPLCTSFLEASQTVARAYRRGKLSVELFVGGADERQRCCRPLNHRCAASRRQQHQQHFHRRHRPHQRRDATEKSAAKLIHYLQADFADIDVVNRHRSEIIVVYLRTYTLEVRLFYGSVGLVGLDIDKTPPAHTTFHCTFTTPNSQPASKFPYPILISDYVNLSLIAFVSMQTV